MDDEQDAEDAIRALDQKEFGRQGRRLRVDWTKQERGGRRSGGSRSSGNSKPTKTLFVINFDPMQTRTSDLEKHFDPYGKILSIRIRRNFAFVQYELQEDATKALDATNMSKLMDQVVSVEYAVRDDDGRRNKNSPDQRDRGRSPDRSRDHRRSRSPPRRQRDSPDYGHGQNSERSRDRLRLDSPQGRDRDGPDYGGRQSPNIKQEHRGNIYPRERESPDSRHAPSSNTRPEPRDRPYGRDRISPYFDGSSSPNRKPERRGNLYRRGRDSPDPRSSPRPNRKPEPKSPPRKERDSPDRAHSGSPYTKPETRQNSNQQARGSLDAGHSPSPNTKYEQRVITKDTEHGEVTKENGRDEENLGPVASPRCSKPEPSGSSKQARTRGLVYEKKHRSRSPSTRKTPRDEKKQRRVLTDV